MNLTVIITRRVVIFNLTNVFWSHKTNSVSIWMLCVIEKAFGISLWGILPNTPGRNRNEENWAENVGHIEKTMHTFQGWRNTEVHNPLSRRSPVITTVAQSPQVCSHHRWAVITGMQSLQMYSHHKCSVTISVQSPQVCGPHSCAVTTSVQSLQACLHHKCAGAWNA